MSSPRGAGRVFGRPEVSTVRPDGHTIFFPESEAGEQRLLIYVGLAFVLTIAVISIHRLDGVSGPELHSVLEAVATVLAFVVGALALVRFYSRKRSTYLLLGTGLVADALLEGFHLVVTAPFAGFADGPEFEALTAWSWIASRLFLAVFLFVSWIAWYSEKDELPSPLSSLPRPVGGGLVRERWVFVTAGLLTLAILVFFSTAPLAPAYRPEALLSRPGEFAPGLLFSLALAGFLTKGDWKRDAFEHWLVIALIGNVAAHFGLMIFSEQLYDSAFVGAHVMKILSYLAVLIGLMASVYITFRREGEASAAILQANQALANEVKIRGRAEKVLQESEERLQDFLDNATDLIQSTDAGGRLLYVNDAWKRTLGYRDDEITDLDILSVVHPDSRDSFREMNRRIFQGEEISDFEVVFVAKNGSSVICSGSANCRFEGGRPVATRSIFRDVTEERRAAGELARSQANVRALFESTGDAIWSVDRRHRLITFNTAYALMAEVLSGRAPSVGDEMWRLTPAADLAWFKACYERALSGSRFSAVREDRIAGQERVFELFFNPIEGERGIDGVVVFSKDVTRRRMAEEALKAAKLEAEDANLAKSQFLASMSHELRTPLNSVIGFANILLKKRSGSVDAKEVGYLERILANGKHLLSLINEVLDLSKIEAGRMELELDTVDLGGLIESTLSQMEGQVAGKPVKLRSELPATDVAFRTDPGKLKQVLINLVGNALKFTSQGDVVVTVVLGRSGVPERIDVRDTGPGIPAERLEAIFEAFQQADTSTTRRFGGTGLGLTISRSLCALMGYRISVASTLGEGSTFSVHLAPAVEAADEEIGKLEAPPAGRWAQPGIEGETAERNWTVLVVDDEADSRTLLRHYLEEVGCRVLTASDGIEGMELARRERPDLITLDLMLHRMSGWEMLSALRQDPSLRAIPVIVVSGLTEGAEDLPESIEVVRKPVDRDTLLKAVRRSLPGGARRVLLVEDNPDTRVRIHRYLRDAGLAAWSVEDGESALAYVSQSPVDLVLLDLLLPGMDGLETLRRLRRLPAGRTVPVVVLTAKDLSATEKDVLGAAADGVIMKGPDVEEELTQLLDNYFATGAPALASQAPSAPTSGNAAR
jgi:PAS domain S-box-containing protein